MAAELAAVTLFCVGLVGGLGLWACSSSSMSVGAATCSPAACSAGSQCIAGLAEGCKKVCTRQTDCPSGTYCNDAQPTSWCAPSTLPAPLATSRAGQFGAPCRTHDACDREDGFACYATGTSDATAFCTFLNCGADSDCPGGWWCARVNTAPNVATDTRSFGDTLNWCLPREYCAPCSADHDCQSPLSTSGTEKHCVSNASGSGFCAPQCGSNTNCPPDAQCMTRWTVCGQKSCRTSVDCPSLGGAAEECLAGTCKLPCTTSADCPPSNLAPQHCDAGACVPESCASDDDCAPTAGTYQHCNAGTCTPECGAATDCGSDQTCQSLSVCTPRAGRCVGDGSLCSPCQSDGDCTRAGDPSHGQTGYCLDGAPYSTERFCSQTVAGGACLASGPPPGGCPARPNGASARGVACTSAATPFAPANQCVGYVLLGTSTGSSQRVPGCWTPNR